MHVTIVYLFFNFFFPTHELESTSHCCYLLLASLDYYSTAPAPDPVCSE